MKELVKFWNDAIAYDSHYRSSEYVFVSLSQENLKEVLESFLESPELLNPDFYLEYIASLGGVSKSYSSAINFLLRNKAYVHYPYLSFSFFTFIAFQLDSDDGYWAKYNEIAQNEIGFCPPNNFPRIYYDNSSGFFNKVVHVLKKDCSLYKKQFIDLNIYGEATRRSYTGRIYAHSIFYGKSIESIKKAIYRQGFHEIPVENYDESIVGSLLEVSNTPRISKLFVNQKELVIECLKLSIKGWVPSLEEQSAFGATRERGASSNAVLKRIWHYKGIAEGRAHFSCKYGFEWRKNLGLEGRLYLNSGSEIYIDLDNSPGFIAESNSFVYIIKMGTMPPEGLFLKHPSITFSSNHLNLMPQKAALKKLNDSYYMQIDSSKVTFSETKVFHISQQDIKVFPAGVYPIAKNGAHLVEVEWLGAKLGYYMFNVQVSVSLNAIGYIRLDSQSGCNLSGIGDGVPGSVSFLHGFPVIMNDINTFGANKLDLFKGDTLFNTVDLASSGLSPIIFNDLPVGKYYINISKEDGSLWVFPNGSNSLVFEITKGNNRDNRQNALPTASEVYDFTYINNSFTIKSENLENNWYIIYTQTLNYLKDEFFDFIFSESTAYVKLDRKNFFMVAFPECDYHKNFYDETYYPAKIYNYHSTSKGSFRLKVRPVSYGNIALPANKNWYNNSPSPIRMKAFEFVLEENGLLNACENAHNRIFIITNYTLYTKPEKLLNIYLQKSLPFKINN